jgi:hypothetical protein
MSHKLQYEPMSWTFKRHFRNFQRNLDLINGIFMKQVGFYQDWFLLDQGFLLYII